MHLVLDMMCSLSEIMIADYLFNIENFSIKYFYIAYMYGIDSKLGNFPVEFNDGYY